VTTPPQMDCDSSRDYGDYTLKTTHGPLLTFESRLDF
jgi:hypothetical protein